MLEPPLEAETPSNDKAPSLLVLLHHHDTQLSRLQIVPSRAPIVEQLLFVRRHAPGPLRALADAGYTESRPKVLSIFDLGTIELQQPLMGMKASVSFYRKQLTLTRIGRC